MRVLPLIAALSLIASPVLADNIRDNNLNLQGQQQGQAQGQGQLSINENDARANVRSNNNNLNGNTNLNGNSNRNANRSSSNSNAAGVGVGVSESNSGALSGSESGAVSGSSSNSEGGDSSSTSGAYSEGSAAGATSEGINGVANTTSFTEEGDTTIVLPDPVDITLPQNTQPGLTAQCRYFGMSSDYINGRSTSVSLYVFGFGSSKTPSDIHETGVQGMQSALVCGLSDQVLDQLTGESSLLRDSEKAALQRMAADQLMDAIYRANGKEYKPRYLDLESINRTPIPTVESLN